MHRRKYVAIGITLVAMLVLAACGGDATATATPTDVPSPTLMPTPTAEPITTSMPDPTPVATPVPTTVPTRFDEDIASRLQAVLEDDVASSDTSYPGAVLHVSSPSLGTWTGAAGLSNVETNTAMKPNDKFRAGSLTKPMISVITLQLVEDGLFSLDEPLPAVLPESITGKFANSEQITVRMLLNHTGGLPEFIDLAIGEILVNPEKVWKAEEFLDLAATREPSFAPGEFIGYSNTDYSLLGMIIEEATGQSWRQEMRKRIIEPLNLENTLLPDPNDVTIPGDHARGYTDFGSGVFDATQFVNASVVGAPGGQSMVTTPEDLARFWDAVLAGELFQEAGTLDEMLTSPDIPLVQNPEELFLGYGLGVMHVDFGSGIEGKGHTGDTEGGYHVFVFHLEDQDLTISGAVNTGDWKAGFRLIPRALEILVPGYAAPEPERAFTPPITDTDGNAIPGSIATLQTVTLGGLEQSILIRGADVTKPVLLWLHGGPGLPHSPFVGMFQRPELEENFVVVHWDQRGAGKSYSEGLTAEDMRPEKFVSDTLELTDILREMFDQEKIFLFGISWGSALGFRTIMENSEPFHAFIAASEAADWDRRWMISYEWALEQAVEANNSEVIQGLESLQPFDPTNREHTGAVGGVLDLFRGGNLYTEGLWDAVVDYLTSGKSPEYTSADVEKLFAGVGLSAQTTSLDVSKSDYNLFRDFPVSPIPIHFFAGRHDYVTPGELAEEYYNFLEAPAKSFTWFENSAHILNWDEPDKTAQELIRIANETLRLGTASTPEQQPLTDEALAQFAAYIEETRESFNVPGMAVVVVQGGEVAFAQGFGVKEAGSNDPVTPDTLFSIGSTAKTMTAMMAATVVHDGLITWDTPVVEVMPQFQLSDADATGQITLRHLFAHTTGLPNIDLLYFFSGLPPEGIVESLKDVPLNTQPGESRTYQNEAFSVGGYVAAMAAGGEYGDNLLETYVDMMQMRVFDPIGMSTATFSIEETEANANHARPHYTTLNGTLAQTGFDVTLTHYFDLAAIAPAGEVRASAMDVGRFLMTMLADGVAPDGTRVVSKQSLAETWTGQIEMNPDPWQDSLASTPGWTLAEYQGISVVTKDGALGGFIAQMAFVPSADAGIVVLTNIDLPVPSLNVQWRLVEMLYGLEPKLEEFHEGALGQLFAQLSDVYTQLLPVDLESVTPYLGEYESEVNRYTIEWRDGGLWFNWGEFDIVQLLGSPEGGYLSISPSDFYLPFQFVEGEGGSITLVIAGFIEAPKIGGAAGTAVSHGGPVTDYISLVDSLRASGATVDPAGTISQPFFTPVGQLLTVNGEDIQAFEFASEVEADAIAETVSADGSSVGTSMIGWVAPPHFYKAGRLVVVYVGSDSGVINTLKEAMGSQFAGR